VGTVQRSRLLLKVFTRYPVLLAIDDFQALYCRTSYKDPRFSAIKSYHLSMPRLLLEYAGGKRSFVRFTCFLRSHLP
jgi:small subunit ribosomal protein S29